MPDKPANPEKPLPMTEERAKLILSRPLVFGDPEQIAADQFLIELEEIRKREMDNW